MHIVRVSLKTGFRSCCISILTPTHSFQYYSFTGATFLHSRSAYVSLPRHPYAPSLISNTLLLCQVMPPSFLIIPFSRPCLVCAPLLSVLIFAALSAYHLLVNSLRSSCILVNCCCMSRSDPDLKSWLKVE